MKLTLKDCRVGADARLGGDKGINFFALMSESRVAMAAMARRRRARRVRIRARLRQGAQGLRRADRDQAGDRLHARRHGDRNRRDAPAGVGGRCAARQGRGRARRKATRRSNYVAASALKVTDNAVQVLGGHGYIREHPVEMWLRNARGFSALEGSPRSDGFCDSL